MATNEDIKYEAHRIVHSADSDTDDLIDELAAWAWDHVVLAYQQGYTAAEKTWRTN